MMPYRGFISKVAITGAILRSALRIEHLQNADKIDIFDVSNRLANRFNASTL